MTPDEERACYERAAKKADSFTATGLNTIVNAVAAAIRNLPLATESAAPQDTKPQVEKCKASVPPASAADPYGTDSEGWSKNPNHWANKESAAQEEDE